MDSANDTHIGIQIRQRREALGLSREGLAYKAGVSHKTLERLEAGMVTPRRATLSVIEGALGPLEEAAA